MPAWHAQGKSTLLYQKSDPRGHVVHKVIATIVNDIHTSSNLGWTEVYCVISNGDDGGGDGVGGDGVGGDGGGSDGGGGGYNPLILYPYEHFSE